MLREIDPVQQPFDYLWKLPEWQYPTKRVSRTQYSNGLIIQARFLGSDWDFDITKIAFWNDSKPELPTFRAIQTSFFTKSTSLPTEIYTLNDDYCEDIFIHPPFNRLRALAIDPDQGDNQVKIVNSGLVASFIARQLEARNLF